MVALSDPRALRSWRDDWTALEVVVAGLDASGFAAVDTLVELGATVIVFEPDPDPDLRRLVEVVGATIIASAPASPPHLVILSPSWTAGTEWAGDAPVWGDVELAWRVRDKVRVAPWLAVAGVDAASRAVDVLVHVLAASGRRVLAVGAGLPSPLDAVRDPGGFDVVVVQFDAPRLALVPEGTLSPLASACLDVGDGSRVADLGRVYDGTEIACIYAKAVPETMAMVEEAEVVDGCRAIGFDLGMPGPSDLGLVEDIVVDRAFHEARHREALELTTHGELAAAGLGTDGDVRAVLAASALARAAGVEPREIAAAIATFAG